MSEEDDEPQASVFTAWDDHQVIQEHLHGERKATARVELERRKRFENAWTGWSCTGKPDPDYKEPLMDSHWPKHLKHKGKRMKRR